MVYIIYTKPNHDYRSIEPYILNVQNKTISTVWMGSVPRYKRDSMQTRIE